MVLALAMVFLVRLNCAGFGGTVGTKLTVASTTASSTTASSTTLQPIIMPRDVHRQSQLGATFKRRRGSRGRANLSLPRTRRATPPVDVHRWSMMTEAIVRQGPGATTYEHVVDMYCITDLHPHPAAGVGAEPPEPLRHRSQRCCA